MTSQVPKSVHGMGTWIEGLFKHQCYMKMIYFSVWLRYLAWYFINGSYSPHGWILRNRKDTQLGRKLSNHLSNSTYNIMALRHSRILWRQLIRLHSVESPSMVDPQWNIWYWGSKWNLHRVCWSAVACEWGHNLCLLPSRLSVFAVEPQYLLQYFLFLSKVSFESHIQNLQKNSC